MIFDRFYPDHCIRSAYELDYEKLRAAGIRGVIYDIDNTLVEHDAPADERARALFARLKQLGLRACLLSNNDEPRVKKFAEAVGADGYIFKAGKPSPAGYRAAAEKIGCRPDETVFVGDQLFTDIWGAKNARVSNYLVQPIGPEKLLKIRLKRILERPVMAAYKRRKRR